MIRSTTAALMALIVMSGSAHADYERLAAAARSAVIARSTARYVDVDGHEFHIHPPAIRRTRVEGVMTARISGRLSHHLSARTDDQYYYQMTVTEDGVLTEYSERINRGGFASMINAVAGRQPPGSRFRTIRVVGQAPNLVVDAIGYELGRRIDGEWEGAARVTAVAVAAQVAESLQPRRRDLRDGRGGAPPQTSSDTRRPSTTAVAQPAACTSDARAGEIDPMLRQVETLLVELGWSLDAPDGLNDQRTTAVVNVWKRQNGYGARRMSCQDLVTHLRSELAGGRQNPADR